ncbi:MAG: DUF2953 domain-containing protein [Desulfosporosinus sp.]|nr:DUF2953 domain-containing protein [Desulfosporosinus sp.]
MRVLAFFLAMVLLILISFVFKIQVDFRYRRIQEEDHIDISFRGFNGLWQANYQIPTLQLEWEKGPQLEFEQVAESKGGVRKTTTKARVRYLRLEWLSRLWLNIPYLLKHFNRVKRKFYRGIHCKKIHWKVEIGYKDACHTAIAAGSFWAMFGYALAYLYKQVTMEVKSPVIEVIPQFKKEGFFCDVQCIFHLRIGHIILVGLTLLRTFKRGRRG